MQYAAILMVLMCGCTPWAIKAECTVMHKTDYQTQAPEQKCGVKAEVTLFKGGDK